MSILIVEDNPVTVRVIDHILKKRGYDIIVVNSGEDALEQLQSNPQIELIMTDVMMPGMNGLELISEIRKKPEWKDTPIIVCTVMADVETVRKAAEVGCRHFAVKPIKPAQLLEKISETIVREIPVLKEKEAVMSELGLDGKAYHQILVDFAELVNDSIGHLETVLAGKRDSRISVKLADLSEGASLVGAERLKRVFGKHMTLHDGKAELDEEGSGYPLLLRELKLLSRSLPPVPPPSSPESPPKERKKEKSG